MQQVTQPPPNSAKLLAAEASLAYCLDLARLCEWMEWMITESETVNLNWYEPPFPGVDCDHVRAAMLSQMRQSLKWSLSDLKKARSALAAVEIAGRRLIDEAKVEEVA